jgi:hypothetical protein
VTIIGVVTGPDLIVTPLTHTDMPLLVPGIVEPKNKTQTPEDTKVEQKQDKSTETKPSEETSEAKKFDGRKAPGMEGMSDEAVRRFEEAMELEYEKREGGA